MARSAWAFARFVAVASVALVMAGYVSSFTGRRLVEGAAARRLAADVINDGASFDQERFALPDDAATRKDFPGAPRTVPRLIEAGFTVRQCTSPPERFDCVPWVAIAAARASAIPFVVDIRWGAAGGPLSGFAQNSRYVVVFGRVFWWKDYGGWVS